MISCKHCQTPNSLDSTFCKRCGTAFADVDVQEAQAKLDKLVEEGNNLFNLGRIDEALAIAETAVLSNPSSSPSLSLKALCHERRGEIAEALDCAERLVELNPDSEFDKIRRSTLRHKLQTDLVLPVAPDRRLAFIGASAAVVLFLCLGAMAAKYNAAQQTGTRVAINENPASQPAVSNPAPTQTAPSSAVQNPNSGNAGATNPSPTESLVTQPSPDSVPPLRAQDQNRTTGSGSSVPPLRVPTSADSELPSVGSQDIELKPLEPNVPESVTNPKPKLPTSNGSTAPGGSNGDDPTFSTPAGAPKEITSGGAKPAEDEGFVQINVRRGGNPRPGGGSEPVSSTGLEALLRVGSQQYQMGNFAGAARSYEQAVRAGGDAIILNRRLGQAYERLGRTSDAAEAYRRCISAIDSAISSGRGNRDSLTSTRDLCQQALKVLQGG